MHNLIFKTELSSIKGGGVEGGSDRPLVISEVVKVARCGTYFLSAQSNSISCSTSCRGEGGEGGASLFDRRYATNVLSRTCNYELLAGLRQHPQCQSAVFVSLLSNTSPELKVARALFFFYHRHRHPPCCSWRRNTSLTFLRGK